MPQSNQSTMRCAQVLEAALNKARSSGRLLIISRLRAPATPASEASAQTRHLNGDPAMLDALSVEVKLPQDDACVHGRIAAAGLHSRNDVSMMDTKKQMRDCTSAPQCCARPGSAPAVPLPMGTHVCCHSRQLMCQLVQHSCSQWPAA